MPLILAIEPNAKQAQQLASLVRQYLRAELVAEASADAALAAIGARIPDLILTPALLGLRDEAALTEHLRGLGTAASHVQTLAVPILASGPTRATGGGLLGLKRDRGDAETVGCEPALFAEQIGIYLERAAAERAAHAQAAPPPPVATDAVDTGERAAEFPDSTVADPEPAWDAPAEAAEAEPDPLLGAWPLAEPVADPGVSRGEVVAPPPDVMPPAFEQTTAPAAAAAVVLPAPKSPTPAMRSLEMELGVAAAPAAAPPLWRVTEDIEDFYGDAATFAPAAEDPAPSAFDETSSPHTHTAEPAHMPADAPEDEAFIELQLDEALAAVTEPEPQVDAPEDIAHDTLVAAHEPLPDATAPPAPAANDAPVSAASDDTPIVVTDPVAVVADAPAVRQAGAAPRTKAGRPRKPAPPLDDWAYFDPSQSPFKALVRRLDEIAGQAGAGR